jgi:tetratricopeptide (TPR) repeat protein
MKRMAIFLLSMWLALPLAAAQGGVVVGREVLELTRLGEEQLAAGSAINAVPAFLEALSLDRDHADALFGLGVAYLQLASLAEALYAFDRVMALDPERFEAHFNRGLVLARLTRHHEAAAAFGRALRIPTDDARRRAAYVALGTQRWWLEDPGAAADAYAEALRLGAPDVDLFLLRVRALLEAERIGEALVDLLANPVRAEDPRLEHWLAAAYLRDARPVEAIAAYRRALVLDPASGEARLAIAALEERRGEPASVLAALADLDLDGLPVGDAATAWGLVGRAHLALGALAESEASFARWVEVAPTDAGAWQSWGVVLYRQASFEAALEAFQAAQRHDPRDPAVWRNLAAVLTALERYPDAEGWYRRLLELDWGDVQALHHLGWLRAARGYAEEAARLWARACDLGDAPSCDAP